MMQRIFFKATSLDGVFKKLSEFGREALIIAGGTDVMVALRAGKLAGRKIIIDINDIKELSHIEATEAEIHIGAMATHSQIMENEIINNFAPILAEACSKVGTPQTRNRGTIGGNLITLAACADTLPALLALGARVELASAEGSRYVNLETYLYQESERIDVAREILTSIHVPLRQQTEWLSSFYKLARRQAASKSRMTLALLIKTDGTLLSDPRIAVGSVASWPHRIHDAEKMVDGKRLEEVDVEKIATIVATRIEEITGKRRSFAYKMPALKEVVKRSLKQLGVGVV
jgi:CO/xanthine dehydrogenase FAD-binding subunit